jgi:hypothetical protein
MLGWQWMMQMGRVVVFIFFLTTAALRGIYLVAVLGPFRTQRAVLYNLFPLVDNNNSILLTMLFCVRVDWGVVDSVFQLLVLLLG